MSLDAAVAIDGETRSRVAFSDAALAMILQLREQHGPLMFHQSGGCCDGSSPMCYPAGDFITGDSDVLLGVFDLSAEGAAAERADAGGHDPDRIEFWMSREQFQYWSHTHLTVDIVKGRGSGFSLEAPEGMRFLIRSDLLTSFD